MMIIYVKVVLFAIVLSVAIWSLTYLSGGPYEDLGIRGNFECKDGNFVANPKDKVVVINMASYQWSFSYCTITVYKGQEVTIFITSLDVPHGIAIEGYPTASAMILPGQTTVLKFVASKSGEFTYFCTVFCGEGHPKHRGTLIVKAGTS